MTGLAGTTASAGPTNAAIDKESSLRERRQLRVRATMGCSRSCSNNGNLGVLLHHLERVALQWTHLHHLPQVLLQQAKVEPADVASGEVEAPGAFQMNLGRRSCGQ